MQTSQWRGVNLGGWLVLERWLTPDLFSGATAQDEHSLMLALGDKAEAVLRRHRDSFIAESDFAWLAAHGINAVRLPVGYWSFGNKPPFIGCLEYIDRAFNWAEAHQIQIVLDLHAAPGGQNGHKHSGRAEVIEWGESQTVDLTLRILETLAERYKNSTALAGIELLNEPSIGLGRRRLVHFYKRAYTLIRRHCHDDVAIIFHDAFRPRQWWWALRGPRYKNILLDVHLYQVFSKRHANLSADHHLALASSRATLLRRLQRSHQTIVGEWSLAMKQPSDRATVEDTLRQAYADAQLSAMSTARGWFFWNYKAVGSPAWSFRDCVERGWLPPHFN